MDALTSRARLREIFADQKAALVFGMRDQDSPVWCTINSRRILGGEYALGVPPLYPQRRFDRSNQIA
jgi:hypothetical protein